MDLFGRPKGLTIRKIPGRVSRVKETMQVDAGEGVMLGDMPWELWGLMRDFVDTPSVHFYKTWYNMARLPNNALTIHLSYIISLMVINL